MPDLIALLIAGVVVLTVASFAIDVWAFNRQVRSDNKLAAKRGR